MGRKILAAVAALLVSTAAQAEWYQASSKHFVVYSDDSPEKVKAYSAKLERFDKAVRVLRGVKESTRGKAGRVTVYIVNNVDEIQRLYGKGGGNVAGFYQARASGPVAFVPRKSGSGGANELSAEQIFLHEYGHHFMYADWPTAAFPKWFSEGFAEFHATALFRPDGSVTFGAIPLARGYGVGKAGILPASQMLRPDTGKLDVFQNSVLYSRGWLLTHYLTFDTERRTQLVNYITAINAGKSVDEATAALGDADSLDLKMNAYGKRPSLPAITFPAEQLTIGEIDVRKLTSGEEAMMPVLIRSTRGVDKTTAPQVAAEARRIAAAYPNDAAAQNVLAEAEYDAQNMLDKPDFTQAIAAADRALAADPKSVHALLYKGMILQAIAEKAKATDAATWSAIRRQYIAANRIDPEDPQPLILFHASFKAAGAKAPVSAENGLLYAYVLAPYDLGLRITAAKVLLGQDKPATARNAMLPVAYSAHAGKAGEELREVIAVLDKSGSAAALAQMTKLEDDAKAKAEKAKGEKKS
jgi:hypothetical protein